MTDATNAEPSAEELKQIIIDYTYATGYLAQDDDRIVNVRTKASVAVPELIGGKARPSWEAKP